MVRVMVPVKRRPRCAWWVATRFRSGQRRRGNVVETALVHQPRSGRIPARTRGRRHGEGLFDRITGLLRDTVDASQLGPSVEGVSEGNGAP